MPCSFRWHYFGLCLQWIFLQVTLLWTLSSVHVSSGDTIVDSAFNACFFSWDYCRLCLQCMFLKLTDTILASVFNACFFFRLFWTMASLHVSSGDTILGSGFNAMFLQVTLLWTLFSMHVSSVDTILDSVSIHVSSSGDTSLDSVFSSTFLQVILFWTLSSILVHQVILSWTLHSVPYTFRRLVLFWTLSTSYVSARWRYSAFRSHYSELCFQRHVPCDTILESIFMPCCLRHLFWTSIQCHLPSYDRNIRDFLFNGVFLPTTEQNCAL